MVKIYGKTKNFKRKNFKRKPKKSAVRATPSPFVNRNMVRLGNGFPKNITVTHKYSDIITLVSTAGGISTYLFSCNGLYDPDITSTGHQPLWFDQIGGTYQRYCVIASKATFKFMPDDSSDIVPMTCLVMLNDDVNLVTTNPIANAEQTGSSLRFLQMDASSSLVIKKGFSARKTFGADPVAIDRLSGTTTSNPSDQMFYQVIVQTTNQATTQSVIIHVLIEYVAVWTELKDVAQS